MKRKDPREGFHDRIAHRYEEIYDTGYWRFYRELSWKHLVRFLPRERPAWALDLGCGPGWFGRKLRKAGFHVTFLDISLNMLEAARKAVQEEYRPEKVEFVKSDMEDLSVLEPERYSFATAQGDILGFCKNQKRAIRELKRVLKPGARAVLSVDHIPRACRTLVEKGNLEDLGKFLGTGRTEWLARKKEERFGLKMFDAEELQRLFESHGFLVLDLIGKTVLFQRKDEELIRETPLDKLIRLEERVYRKKGWLGLASHIQIAVKKGLKRS